MFRDRTVFKALLDDFTACSLHGSHGTLGSIKHQTNYRHQDVFSSIKSSNPGSVHSTWGSLLSPCFSPRPCSGLCSLPARLSLSPSLGRDPRSHAQLPFPALSHRLSCSFPLPSLSLFTAGASLYFWSFCFCKASPSHTWEHLLAVEGVTVPFTPK